MHVITTSKSKVVLMHIFIREEWGLCKTVKWFRFWNHSLNGYGIIWFQYFFFNVTGFYLTSLVNTYIHTHPHGFSHSDLLSHPLTLLWIWPNLLWHLHSFTSVIPNHYSHFTLSLSCALVLTDVFDCSAFSHFPVCSSGLLCCSDGWEYYHYCT